MSADPVLIATPLTDSDGRVPTVNASPAIKPSAMGAPAADEAGASSKALARLARKAESARQARLRHKSGVQNMHDEIASLRAEVRHLEAVKASWAAQLQGEVQSALPAEQWRIVEGWLREGEIRLAQAQAESAAEAAAVRAAERVAAAARVKQQYELQEQQRQDPAFAAAMAAMPPPPGLPRSLSADEAMEQPELLLCALSMASPALGPAALLAHRAAAAAAAAASASSSGRSTPKAVHQVAAIPTPRAQAHAAAARQRRASVTAAARQSAPKPSGGAVGLKALDLLEAAIAAEAGLMGAVPPKPAIDVGAMTPSPTSITDELPSPRAAALGLFGLAGGDASTAGYCKSL